MPVRELMVILCPVGIDLIDVFENLFELPLAVPDFKTVVND